MDITKAELASAAAASSAGQPPLELRGAEILVKALQAEGVQALLHRRAPQWRNA